MQSWARPGRASGPGRARQGKWARGGPGRASGPGEGQAGQEGQGRARQGKRARGGPGNAGQGQAAQGGRRVYLHRDSTRKRSTTADSWDVRGHIACWNGMQNRGILNLNLYFNLNEGWARFER
eukprot:72674-Chlamydomonas_euryale.AAC.2